LDTKETKVKLVNDNPKVGALELEINHAERLLNMPNNGGWKLPKDTPYKLEKNGLIKKSDNSTTKIAKEQSDNK
jgi:hypothetical protein